jgi:hypothetical protein
MRGEVRLSSRTRRIWVGMGRYGTKKKRQTTRGIEDSICDRNVRRDRRQRHLRWALPRDQPSLMNVQRSRYLSAPVRRRASSENLHPSTYLLLTPQGIVRFNLFCSEWRSSRSYDATTVTPSSPRSLSAASHANCKCLCPETSEDEQPTMRILFLPIA